MVAGRNPLTEARLPELDPALEFTAVTIPNPHLVTVIDKYVESDLIAMGERVAARPDVFPAGANLSVLLPFEPAEVFVRTFERGAGLTASCGSGMAASRAVYSRTGRIDPERRVVVRNAGGMATVSLRVRQGRWHPLVEGNATFVYRAVSGTRTGLLSRQPNDQGSRAHRDGERPAGRDDLAVDLPRQDGIGADLDAARLQAPQRPSWRRSRASTRPASRIQSQPPDGARMPTSSRPSSSRAAGSRVNPPGSSPALATTTDRARRRSGSSPSGRMVNSRGGSPSRRTPAAA